MPRARTPSATDRYVALVLRNTPCDGSDQSRLPFAFRVPGSSRPWVCMPHYTDAGGGQLRTDLPLTVAPLRMRCSDGVAQLYMCECAGMEEAWQALRACSDTSGTTARGEPPDP